MRSFIIAAVARNGVIGSDQDLPWSMPADEAYLQDKIRGCVLLTGRKSLETAQGSDLFRGKLDQTIVLTRQKDFPQGRVVHSIAEAFDLAEEIPGRALAVLGGAEVYRQTIDRVDELLITEIGTAVEGEAHFPDIDSRSWEEVWREAHPADEQNPFPYTFVRYKRKPLSK